MRQGEFVTALLDPAAAVPAGLIGPAGNPLGGALTSIATMWRGA